jgi:hypothetical protein
MTKVQQYIVTGTVFAVLLLLVFRHPKTRVAGGGLDIHGGLGGGIIQDEGLIIEPLGFDWIGGDCVCEMDAIEVIDIDLAPPFFGSVAAYVAPRGADLSPLLTINPFPPAPSPAPAPIMPPAPQLPAIVQPSYTYRATTLRPGDAWVTKKGAGTVPKGLGALAWRLSTGQALALGLDNRPFVQENIFSPNSSILWGGRRYYRSDPV